MTKDDKIDIRLYFSLLLWAFLPTIYTTIRTVIASTTDADINILGSLEWFDLIDETISAFLVTPLYFLLKKNNENRRTAYIAAGAIYTVFIGIAAIFAPHMAVYMHARGAESYLVAECLAFVFGFVATLGILDCTLSGNTKIIRIMTVAKIAGYTLGDVLLVPKFGAIGSAYSDTLTNAMTAAVWFVYFKKGKTKEKRTSIFHFGKNWAKLGLFSGASIFLDNIVYALAVVRIVSSVGEIGTYWIANNIIWGFLIPPATCLAEIVKKRNDDNISNIVWKFCTGIGLLWFASFLLWPWYNTHILRLDAAQSETVMHLLYILVPFYLAYLICTILDAWMISKGMTWTQTLISVVVNIVYYGIVLVLKLTGIYAPTLGSTAAMFGIGMVIHAVLSVWLYRRILWNGSKNST